MKKPRNLLVLIFAFFFVGAAPLLSLLRLPADMGASSVLLSAFCVTAGACGIVVVCMENALRAARFRERMLSASTEEIQKNILETREKIRLDAERARADIAKRIRRTKVRSAGILLCAFLLDYGVCALLNPALDAVTATLAGVSCGGIIFLLFAIEPSGFFVMKPTAGAPAKKNMLSPSEYPVLYAVAARAAEAVGYKGEFYLEYGLGSDNIGVADRGGIAAVSLSPVTAALYTEEELFSVLLHEFAHVKNRDTVWLSRVNLHDYRLRTPLAFAWQHRMYYAAEEQEFSMRTEIFHAYATILFEMQADEAVIACGDAQTYLDATAKGHLLAEFFRRPRRELSYDYFADEQPRSDFFACKLALFEESLPEEYAHLKAVVLRTLPARSDSHPTLAMRMEAFGVDDFDPFKRAEQGAFRDELTKYLADCDARDAALLDWAYLRQVGYLNVRARLAALDDAAEGKPISEYLAMQALFDLLNLDMGRAKEVARKILERGEWIPAEYALGTALCLEDDLAGLPLLEKVIRTDLYNADPAMDLLADTVLRSGDEALLEEYRARNPELMKISLDELKRRRDFRPDARRLTACDLPAERIEAMRASLADCEAEFFIARAQDISEGEKVYLVAVRDPEGKYDGTAHAYFASLDRMGEVVFFLLFPHEKLYEEVVRIGTRLK